MRQLALSLFCMGCSLAAANFPDGGPRDSGRTSHDAAREDAGQVVGDDATVDSPDAGTIMTSDAGPSEATMPVIVAAGSNHTRYLSIDEGLSWCFVAKSTDPEATGFDNPFLFRHISYCGGRFIAGSWRAIFVSDNGVDWTDITGGSGPEIGEWVAQIQFGNDWWVATGGYGTAMRSRDLMTWENTSDSLGGTDASRSLAFGSGLFVTGRDNVGWWQSSDGTGWTQMNPGGNQELVYDSGAFIDDPGYDRGRGIRLRSAWPDGIERATDSDSASYSRVGTTTDTIAHFAFGFAPPSDLARAHVPSDLADCLGL